MHFSKLAVPPGWKQVEFSTIEELLNVCDYIVDRNGNADWYRFKTGNQRFACRIDDAFYLDEKWCG